MVNSGLVQVLTQSQIRPSPTRPSPHQTEPRLSGPKREKGKKREKKTLCLGFEIATLTTKHNGLTTALVFVFHIGGQS